MLEMSSLIENLIKKLSKISKSDLIEEAATDIADIYESAQKILDQVDSFVEQEDSENLQNLLVLLDVELDHLSWHKTNLKKILKKLSLIP